MSNEIRRRRISIYRLIETQRQDLREAGRHLFYKESLKDDDVTTNDVVIVIPPKRSDIVEPLMCFLAERLPQLKIRKNNFHHQDKVVLFISAEETCLRQTAHLMGIDVQSDMLTSQQKQSVIKYYLDSLRFFKTRTAESTSATGNCVTLPGVTFREGEAVFGKLRRLRIIESIFPLHSYDDLCQLRKSWLPSFFSRQPLDSIQVYFGHKIAMYFAFLGHYTFWLTIPAFLGLLLASSSYFLSMTQFAVDLCTILFTLTIILWSSLYLRSLQGTCKYLSEKWAVSDCRQQQEHDENSTPRIRVDATQLTMYGIRSNFIGEVSYDEKKDEMRVSYPEWKRQVRKWFVSTPVIIACLLVLFVIMTRVLHFQSYWDEVLILHYGFHEWTSFVPKVVFAVIISVMDSIYHRIAVFLNDFENYAFEVEHENSLVCKLVIFQFTNSFMPLFFLAFYVGDMQKLEEQLMALLITRQVLGNVMEALWPFIYQSIRLSPRLRLHRQKSNADEDDNVTSSVNAAEVESFLSDYESTYDDYLEMFLQFGHVILFSSTFPLAAMCALVNNFIEIRSDAFKLCVTHRRPFAGQKVKDIGEWLQAMNILVYASVVISSALMVKSGLIQRLCPYLTDTQVILCAMFLEHIMIFTKIVVESKEHLPFFGFPNQNIEQ